MSSSAYQRREAALRHRDIRQVAYEIVGILYAEQAPGVNLRETIDEDLLTIEAWRENCPSNLIHIKANWDWEVERRKIIRREARVDLAICQNSTLHGIALGRVSRRRVVATIHFMERNLVSNPFEDVIGPLCVSYLEELAKLLNCKEICIDRPVQALLPYYEALGFDRPIKKGRRVVRLLRSIELDESQVLLEDESQGDTI
ncbi:hypothetical protein [Xanthomonas axonopodis]|uniref:hypothetical protein n=1 Tax=Xanthomonas axonopodis TaxID=53413 RepID=UPI0035584681